MHSHHPYLRQECRKSNNQLGNRIKDKLYRTQGCPLSRELMTFMRNKTEDWTLEDALKASELIGQANAYVKARRSMTPDIPAESGVNSIEGQARKIHGMLERWRGEQ